MNETTPYMERQFSELLLIIQQRRSEASRAVNEKQLLTAWSVGGYISVKLKSEVWGSKVVAQLAEYIRTQAPDVKGFGRSSLYNMVMFYDEYSSPAFLATVRQYLHRQIVQPVVGQMPSLLLATSYSNHIEILCNCKSNEQRLFYILHAKRERLGICTLCANSVKPFRKRQKKGKSFGFSILFRNFARI